MSYKHSQYILIAFLSLFLLGCKDDFIPNGYNFGEGDGKIKATVTFTDVPVSLSTRSVTGGTNGDAIEAINSLCVLVYDSKGNYINRYTHSATKKELANYKAETVKQTSPDDAVGDKEHQAQTSTVRATFSLGNPAETLPYGVYHIYAVANMGDLSGETFETEEDLKKIILKWDSEHIANNNQMFGYFTNTGKEKSEGFGPENVIVSQPEVSIHSWIKRAVSKVTIAFDGRNLKENVSIYLKSARIVDIPDECYLGANNPDQPDTQIQFAPETQEFVYGTGTNYGEGWEARVTNGHPIYGFNTNAINDPDKSLEEKLKAQHEETTNAFYFFENMQGKGVAGTMTDKRQQVNDKDKQDQVTSYPDGVKPDNAAWKDAKKYGSYIEVQAYYISTNPGDFTRGEITYRFMLGKDVELDYDAQRNYHYKLTLCFNGYANDVDWHIDYKREHRDIQNPNPYYISYLYNHSMMLPLKVTTGAATITKIEAVIENNGWAPLTTLAGATMDLTTANAADYYDKYYLYYAGGGVTDSKSYACNGFLSLRPTILTVVTGEPPYYIDSNQLFYGETGRGNVTYIGEDLNTGDMTLEQALNAGKPHLQLSQDGNNNVYDVNIPMWTRAKQLIKGTGYTGNNPYTAYQREAKVKVTITLSDGTELTTGIKTDQSDPDDELITIKQVRRIVNPKGIWRSAANTDPFHVVLKILPNEEATNFEALPSEGPWRAYVMRDANDAVSLKGSPNTETGQITVIDKNGISGTYNTIEGKGGSNIDFHIEFNKTATDANPNYAIVRVEYNNYSCYHLIFIRQGYGAADDLIEGGKRWFTSNNLSKDERAENPLNEGSMFKFGNWDQPIAPSNNKNSKAPWVNVVPNDFAGNAAKSPMDLYPSGTSNWNDIKAKKYNDENGFSNPGGMKVADYDDYLALYNSPDIEYGYGVLYGDGATKTATTLNAVYGHMGEQTDSLGIRGCFVYNYRTGKNLFFPTGASGYGHRKRSLSANGKTYSGVLRYSCAARWGYFDVKGGSYPKGVEACPLFFDIFRRPGAIYWFQKYEPTDKIQSGGSEANNVGWDFNYFTFDFFPISRTNVMGTGENDSDALFVRCVAN